MTVRTPALIVGTLLLLASACGGDDGGSSAAEEASDGACSLLSDDEIEAATGVVPSGSEPPPIAGGCTWFSKGDAILMALEIAPDATTSDGEPASRYELTLARHEASSIESTDVDGLGDRADASGAPVANNIIVVRGDQFLDLTINESDALTDVTVEDLMALVIDRL